MSHTMNIRIELHDRQALEAACRRLGIRMQQGKHHLYSSEQEGIGVFLEGWQYPAVIRPDGTVAYDNYNGRWGDEARLHELQAHYGLEKARQEATRMGYTCTESQEGRELVLRVWEA